VPGMERRCAGVAARWVAGSAVRWGHDGRGRPAAVAGSLRKMLVPLALAQFICSFAGSNMNVMINDIKDDLHTTVQGVQVCASPCSCW
jgi:hypothetical protein